jgi:hypothetical protein
MIFTPSFVTSTFLPCLIFILGALSFATAHTITTLSWFLEKYSGESTILTMNSIPKNNNLFIVHYYNEDTFLPDSFTVNFIAILRFGVCGFCFTSTFCHLPSAAVRIVLSQFFSRWRIVNKLQDRTHTHVSDFLTGWTFMRPPRTK